MATTALTSAGRLRLPAAVPTDDSQNRNCDDVARSPASGTSGCTPVSEVEVTETLEQHPARDTVRIPRIAIHAFYHRSEIGEVVERAAGDRLMSRTRVTMHAGGAPAAIELYRDSPTPNLIVIESRSPNNSFLSDLDILAEVCDAGTRLMVVGDTNDVSFYRQLLKRGVSEYVLAPLDAASLVAAISNIYRDDSSKKLGHTFAFIGAKGGVGSSTIAQNVAWLIGRDFASDVILADLDLPFGTAALNFNTEGGQGIAEAIHDASRLDHVLLDRLLTKCGDHVGLLSAPAALERAYDLDLQLLEPLLEVAQSTVPYVILDVPHQWSSWSRGLLDSVDEVVIVATPELASMRNAKNLVTILKQTRPHDPAPKLILNQTGVPKRPEIKPADFAKAVQTELTACIPFDAHLFGNASNKGQMIAEISHKGEAVKALVDIASSIAGRRDPSGRRSAAPRVNAVLKKLFSR